MTVVLTCVKDTLDVGRQQSLALEIKSDADGSITVVIPLGSGAAALMTEEQFGQTTIDCNFDPPDVQVTPTVRDGVARLRVGSGGAVAGEVCLEGFLVAVAGTVEIRAVDFNNNTLAKTSVTKAATPPVIESFEADPYNLPNGGEIELDWRICPEPADDMALFIGDRLVDSGPPVKRQVAGQTAFTLSLRSRTGQVISQRQLWVHAKDHTGFYGYKLKLPSGPPRGIIGVHAGNGFLYVLVREDDAVASLWKTTNGFDLSVWQEALWTSGDAAPIPLRIPLAAARRPGVIFQNKLWLLGGDCCNPDLPLARVGSHDFRPEHGGFRDEAAPWPARMGHAVFTDGTHIWVVGGWRQGGGALNDIWLFNGMTWMRLPDPPWRPRCLFGATATSTEVWIAGGFDTPGGKTYDDIWRYAKSSKKWEKLDAKLCQKDEHQYVAGSMFALRDQPRAFTVHYDPDTGRYPVTLHTMYKYIDKWRKDTAEYTKDLVDTLPKLDYYAINTTEFSRAVFLWVSRPNPGKPGAGNVHPDSLIHYYITLEAAS